MKNEFDNFDLRAELDKEAFDILDRGNSDLAFGGSSKQEAQTFGSQINANDAPRVGAFLGGVALANLKVQNQRADRFARIRSLQDEILKREQQVLDRDRLDANVTIAKDKNATDRLGQKNLLNIATVDNATSIQNNENNNATSIQNNENNNATSAAISQAKNDTDEKKYYLQFKMKESQEKQKVEEQNVDKQNAQTLLDAGYSFPEVAQADSAMRALLAERVRKEKKVLAAKEYLSKNSIPIRKDSTEEEIIASATKHYHSVNTRGE